MGEFGLIHHLFGARAGSRLPPLSEDWLGIGDDAALLPSPSEGHQLVWALDTMVEGRHFPPNAPADSVGHKLLAVNLSDLAAMGAEPMGCLLSLAVDKPRLDWLEPFAGGLLAAAERFGCPLVGGDTVSLPPGQPMVLSLTVLGRVPSGRALRRDGMAPVDELWLFGALGEAAIALRLGLRHNALDRPCPLLEVGIALRGRATAAIDVSDGLVSEVRHLLKASSGRRGLALQACLDADALIQTAGPATLAWRTQGEVTEWEFLSALLGGGDDYALVCSLPPEQVEAVRREMAARGVPAQRIGQIRERSPAMGAMESADLVWQSTSPDRLAQVQQLAQTAGHDHFREV